ncbi:hypothetical protein PICSAR11_04006 [Mycobacterium avium subsp. paratuberculosis]|nr:hypothetical protein PICSAR113_00217 [Mycobacterium avium subsp. paratuberculosis]CAG6855066.1 hypothetical protein PICSAR102_00361 [Mycobacterium avium subsp. paratuberculosis]CAG6859193.1 hypothetical protein PICSAR119_00561 [Mycobacterium avium subsp. paratuberculosis]CAG6862772.1 hypothetical protein PICSAR10_00742 [Mycobacterium avium subsp. paratuberculosis]CAG6882197.1 hypothetical protein PICSAR120_01694 [Mycobacterium avium subsp. paratuberculosis]
MPTLRSWSAAVLATATAVGSLAATPMASESCWPSLLIRPRMTSGGPVLGGPGAGVAGEAEVLGSTLYPAPSSNASAAGVVIAGGAVGS